MYYSHSDPSNQTHGSHGGHNHNNGTNAMTTSDGHYVTNVTNQQARSNHMQQTLTDQYGNIIDPNLIPNGYVLVPANATQPQPPQQPPQTQQQYVYATNGAAPASYGYYSG